MSTLDAIIKTQSSSTSKVRVYYRP